MLLNWASISGLFGFGNESILLWGMAAMVCANLEEALKTLELDHVVMHLSQS